MTIILIRSHTKIILGLLISLAVSENNESNIFYDWGRTCEIHLKFILFRIGNRKARPTEAVHNHSRAVLAPVRTRTRMGKRLQAVALPRRFRTLRPRDRPQAMELVSIFLRCLLVGSFLFIQDHRHRCQRLTRGIESLRKFRKCTCRWRIGRCMARKRALEQSTRTLRALRRNVR